jgi:hypothetical protein
MLQRTYTLLQSNHVIRNEPPQFNGVSIMSVHDAERTRLDMNISSRLNRATVRMSWSPVGGGRTCCVYGVCVCVCVCVCV